MLNKQYVAGLFDGEGCFVITKSKNGSKSRQRAFYYKAECAIEIREEYIVDHLVEMYGGCKTKKVPKNSKHSVTFRWKLSGPGLKIFCEDMLPILLIKNEQANVVLKFISIRDGLYTSKITDEQLAEQEVLREYMKKLNEKGVGYQHRQLIKNNTRSDNNDLSKELGYEFY